MGQKQKRINNIFLFFVFTFVLFCLPKISQAATIYFAPAAGSFKTGDLINVSIKVNTQDKAINNVDGTIYFPTDTLEVISLSKSGSIFSMWVEDPNFSNSAGSISFNGGVPTPGFTGSAGKVLGIVFRAKKAGTASVSFSSASIRANDGFGTNILTGSGQAQFVITGTAVQPVEKPKETPKETPKEPQNKTVSSAISSNTHPDPNQWYNLANANFSWSLPSGVTEVKISYDEKSDSQPTVSYKPAVSSKSLSDLKDGAWYFHLQLKNASGWGAITHFRFQIDTSKPKDFSIKPDGERELTDPIGKFVFTATDEGSGIDHFVVKIDSGEEQAWTGKSGEVYSTPVLTSGVHILFVKALDKLGNYLADSVSLEVQSLEAPIFSDYPEELVAGEDLVLSGKTRPNSEVLIWIEKEGEKATMETVSSDAEGNFTFTLKKGLKNGNYNIWASATDSRGAQSGNSGKLSILVKKLDMLNLGMKAINFLSLAIVLVALVILLLLLVLFAWRKILLFKSNRPKKENQQTEEKLNKMIDALRDDIRAQIDTVKTVKAKQVASVTDITSVPVNPAPAPVMMPVAPIAAPAPVPVPEVVVAPAPVVAQPSLDKLQLKFILGDYDITAYSADPLHEQKVSHTLNNMPVLTTAAEVDEYIQKIAFNSPVTAAMILAAANVYKADYRLILALMQEESNFGTVGLAVSTMNPGNIGNTGTVIKYFASWQEGVMAVAEWLSRHKVATANIAPTSPKVTN